MKILPINPIKQLIANTVTGLTNWSTRFSASGALFFFHGCLALWFSKMQRSVTLSSAEAEFFGAMLACKEMIFFRDLLIDLGFSLPGPSSLYSDSQSAVNMSYDPIAFKKTKHILRASQFLRDLVLKGVVRLHHISGELMLADFLTKALPRATFRRILASIDDYSTASGASLL